MDVDSPLGLETCPIMWLPTPSSLALVILGGKSPRCTWNWNSVIRRSSPRSMPSRPDDKVEDLFDERGSEPPGDHPMSPYDEQRMATLTNVSLGIPHGPCPGNNEVGFAYD